MTIPNRPRVMIVSGSEKILMMGFTNALSRPRINATTASVVRSSP